jgi:hypothetical protein
MTDHPRYEPVKGPPAVAHRHYGGAGFFKLVFWLIERQRGSAGAATVRDAPALDPSSGQIAIHERPPPQGPRAEHSADDELVRAHARLAGRFPDEAFSRDFLLSSARTRRLQVGLLAAFLAVCVGLLVQTLSATRGQPRFAEQSTASAPGRAP